jgi:hypothetical protein
MQTHAAMYVKRALRHAFNYRSGSACFKRHQTEPRPGFDTNYLLIKSPVISAICINAGCILNQILRIYKVFAICENTKNANN